MPYLTLSFVFVFQILSVAIPLVQMSDVAKQQHSSTEPIVQEYCTIKEPFEANCLKNEVIVMKSATYGRMKVGRCLQKEDRQIFAGHGTGPKFLGCSEDVMHLMNMKCSGKNRCEVRVMFDKDFESLAPCYDGLQLYLEASYSCVTVIESDRSCMVTATSNSLHIQPTSTNKLGCGTKSQPWIIEAPNGQQINVSLLDFGLNTNDQIMHEMDSCQQYGYIIDKTTKKNVSICRQDREGQSVVYRSHSNSIEVVTNIRKIEGNEESGKQSRILIGFYAIGCSNMVPPEDTWLRRNDNEATIGCYSSHQTWHLRCAENQWIGVIGNCSRDKVEKDLPTFEMKSSTSDYYQVTIMVAVAVIALIICVTIICCGAVCLKRHYVLSARKHFHLIDESNKKNNGVTPDYHFKTVVQPND